MRLQEQDPDIYRIFAAERRRQREGVELIPSENYVSEAVLEAMGTIFTNKDSEGYPGRRYYGGNENVDAVERLAQERARRLFGVPHANVQPYSGSPANLAVYLATCQPGDPIMGQNLPDGGHLTHGWKVSVTGTTTAAILITSRPTATLISMKSARPPASPGPNPPGAGPRPTSGDFRLSHAPPFPTRPE